MFLLRNDFLRVEILDPARDRDKLGSRYCAGGYIWSAADARGRALFAGPFHPGATTGFDGQGAPEVFETVLGENEARVGDGVCVPGVGLVRRDSPVEPFHARDNPVVTRFADWTVEEPSTEEIRMHARQEFRETRLDITRIVRIRGESLESRTDLGYAGEHPLALRWFAHPFFPPLERLCRFSTETSLPANPAFGFESDGTLWRNPGYPWDQGFYQPLGMEFGKPLRVEQFHPVAGTVVVECDWPLAWLPVWGNARAFSFEPYHVLALRPDSTATWSIRYTFGAR